MGKGHLFNIFLEKKMLPGYNPHFGYVALFPFPPPTQLYHIG